MATYTMELRKVCDYYSREEVENWFKSYNLRDFLREDEIQSIETAGLWNKERLARKIVDHYFMREIGFETPALFSHYAKVTMLEIMEEKLPLIYSSSIKYNPLVNVDFTESFERNRENSNKNTSIGNSSNSTTINGSGTSTSESSSNSLNIVNNTPQKRITAQDLSTGAYASSVNQNETSNVDSTENSTSSNTSSSSTDNTTSQGLGEETENYIKKIKGNSGVSATAQKMIEQYRQNIVAIDKQIIEELNILFMGLY